MRVLVDWDIPDRERPYVEAWPGGIEIVKGGSRLSRAEKLALAPSVDVHAGLMRTADREYLEHATNLKLVQMTGHGVDLLLRDDIPALLKDRGTRVATADSGSIGIAEYAIMSMIMLSRRVLASHAALSQRGDWQSSRGPELFGATLCIIGYGGIGQVSANYARALGMKVGVVTRSPKKYLADGMVFVESFDRINAALAQADYVLLTAPLTQQTYNLVGREQFAAMKRGAYFVSITRGPLTEEKALFEALASGQLAGAALDCWWREEEDGTGRNGYPSLYPIHAYNVLMTPHNSGTTFGTRQRALTVVGENIARLMNNQPLENEVAMEDLARMAS